MLDTFRGILIPFLGTVLGAACVLFLQKNLNRTVQRRNEKTPDGRCCHHTGSKSGQDSLDSAVEIFL